MKTKSIVGSLILCLGLSTAAPSAFSAPPLRPVIPAPPIPLTGREMLLEAVDQNGMLGIYAFDVLAEHPKPRLLVRGATTPRWSVHHRKFLFLKHGAVWIYNNDGQQTLWSKDSSLDRFSNPERLARDTIAWDAAGDADLIDYLPAFGRRLNRSISLHEDVPPKPVKTGLRGFIDSIVPIQGAKQHPELMCVGAVSLMPDKSKLVAQVYPSLPRDLDARESHIVLYNLLYGLSKTDPAQWEAKLKRNKAYFYEESMVPQVEGPGHVIGSPTPDDIDIEPAFSPDGQYIAFNRINTTAHTLSPVIVKTAEPDKVIHVSIEPLADQGAVFPDQVWGWPHHSSVGWSGDRNTLWLLSGHEDTVYAVHEVNGTWKADLVCGLLVNEGPFSYYATYQGWFAGIYSGDNDIILFSERGDENNRRVVALPENWDIPAIEW